MQNCHYIIFSLIMQLLI